MSSCCQVLGELGWDLPESEHMGTGWPRGGAGGREHQPRSPGTGMEAMLDHSHLQCLEPGTLRGQRLQMGSRDGP